MHCKPTPGNILKNKNKLPNFECTLRVKKQWEQMHYLIIKKHTQFNARLRRELRLPEAREVRTALRNCCKQG